MGHTDGAPEPPAPRRRRGPQRDAVATQARILEAARQEFAENGLQGARMEAIASRAGCNKALIHHYFQSKDALFAIVLEKNYEAIRTAERNLQLTSREPHEAMRELVGFSFDYVSEHPEFISLINEENLHGGVHVAHSGTARELNSPLVATIEEVLERGVAEGIFRAGVDPVQLYITIASISYFFIANRATLTAIFDLPKTDDVLAARRAHAIDVVLGYLRPDPVAALPGSPVEAVTPAPKRATAKRTRKPAP
ncbi:TetR family transcriptional regulator [Acuticoccus sediminis]|uniref:TetR family transcriptional regulator n=1 Tax=Acuticoccus sediminis TaxID=2184697 RepID=A0A8B2NQJ5_9HYPH|nr:TetR/AcrR family transcriptional regulator [Acuticoccus sediminis]RAI02165.1 TetR family transcriptional regulator [Acuticoccus sediminis]